jgi:hypothetical protein
VRAKGRGGAANVYQIINGHFWAVLGLFDPDLVQFQSIPKDLRAEMHLREKLFFLIIYFSPLPWPALVKTQKRDFGSAVLRFQR